MKKVPMFCTLFALAAFTLSSCAEEDSPAYVWGAVSANVIDPPASSLNGSLAKGGERYFGFCDYDEDKKTFSFGVGSGKPSPGNSSDWYVVVEGIQGPPEESVFGPDGKPKSDDLYQTSFDKAVVTQLYSWVVENADVDSDYCNVGLFAEAGDGEVEPKSQKRFRYYVKVRCTGIDVKDRNDSGINMTQLDASLYFKGCD